MIMGTIIFILLIAALCAFGFYSLMVSVLIAILPLALAKIITAIMAIGVMIVVFAILWIIIVGAIMGGR